MRAVQGVAVGGAACGGVESGWSGPDDVEQICRWRAPDGSLITTVVAATAEPLRDAARGRLVGAVMERLIDLDATKDQTIVAVRRVRDVAVVDRRGVVTVDGGVCDGVQVSGEGFTVVAAQLEDVVLVAVTMTDAPVAITTVLRDEA